MVLPSLSECDAVAKAIMMIQNARDSADPRRRELYQELLRILDGQHARTFMNIMQSLVDKIANGCIQTIRDLAESVSPVIRQLDDKLCSESVDPSTRFTYSPGFSTNGDRLSGAFAPLVEHAQAA